MCNDIEQKVISSKANITVSPQKKATSTKASIESTDNKRKKKNTSISYKCFDVFLLIFSLIFILASVLGLIYEHENKLWFLLFFSIAIFTVAIMSMTGAIDKLSYIMQGVFLTKDQIEKLEKKLNFLL